MKTYGYIRVSTAEQNEDRQLITMSEYKIPPQNIYTDKQSGKDFNRPAYKSLVRELRKGDLLYVKSIDRLGRNYEDILSQWRTLTKEKGVDIVVIDMPILDTRSKHGGDLIGTVICDVVLQLLSFVAQNQRESIRQNQAEGIQAAKAKGVKFGRPEKKPPAKFCELVRKWERKQIPLSDVLDECDCKETTFYKMLREYRIRQGQKE